MKPIIIIATTLMLVSGTANAQSRADMGKAVQELGVSPREMRSCVKQSGMKPRQNLSERQRAKIGGLLLNCLQKINPDLTKKKFTSTMMRFK